MGRLTREELAAQEIRIKAAICGIKDGTYWSGHQAHKALDVPKSTLCDRLKNKPTRVTARESQQNLSAAEEKALIRWILLCSRTGYPVRRTTVYKMAEAIRIQRIRKINTDKSEHISYPKLSKNWVS